MDVSTSAGKLSLKELVWWHLATDGNHTNVPNTYESINEQQKDQHKDRR